MAGLLAALPVTPGYAAPLEPEACSVLKTEFQGLVTDGTKADMERGPEWAKANLAPEKLSKIERLIAVEELLSFRCGEPVTARPLMKELPKPQGGAAVASNGGRGTMSRIPLPKRKDAAKAARKLTATQ